MTGCFRDKSDAYIRAEEVPVLSVPEGKSTEGLQEIYAIPPVEDALLLNSQFEVPRPAPLVSGSADQLVRIQRLGEESWALIAMAPGQVWPQVRGFLAAAGAQVARVDARAGIMETDWVNIEGEPMASRFQFRIEQGVQRGNSELHVLQMHQAGDINAWPARSDDKEQEDDILHECVPIHRQQCRVRPGIDDCGSGDQRHGQNFTTGGGGGLYLHFSGLAVRSRLGLPGTWSGELQL